MPRVSDAEKQKSHQRILSAAAGVFREKGIETTSVAEVMNAAGMTHGGFYRHFADKDELVDAAFRTAVDVSIGALEAADDAQAARAAYVDTYLSDEHVENRAIGCPMAALGSELARTDGATKQSVSDAVGRVAALLESESDGDSGYAQLSMLIGAVTLARLVEDTAQSDTILKAAAAAINKIA